MKGNDVREIRTALKMTVAQFAAELQVDRTTVWRWESGERIVSPPYPRLIKLLVATGELAQAG